MMHSTAHALKDASHSPATRGGSALPVLARVPDAAAPAIELWRAPEDAPPWHARLWGRSVRTYLLLGAAAALVLIAIVPFLFPRAKPSGSILPAQDQFSATPVSDASKAWTGYAATDKAVIEKATTGVKPITAVKPAGSTAEIAGVNLPPAEPADKTATIATADARDRTGAQSSPWPNPTPDAARLPAPPTPAAPAASVANSDRYPMAGAINRPMSLDNPPIMPAPATSVAPAVPVNGYPAESLADRQMTPPPRGVASPFEPGTARFEGTIEKPSVRTTYDRPRPGIY